MDPEGVAAGKGKKSWSVYLKHFNTSQDGNLRICKYCGKEYNIKTSTGNLGFHLKSKHANCDMALAVSASAPQQHRSSSSATRQYCSSSSASQLHQKQHQSEVDQINWVLFTLASLPPTLDDSALSRFLKPLRKGWSKEGFQTALCEIFDTMQQYVLEMVDQVYCKMSIILDFWTSYQKLNYVGITCMWIDESWCLRRVLLDICQFSSSRGLADSVLNVLKFYKMHDRIICFTHNNSLIAQEACQTLREAMGSNSFNDLPCIARTLSSALNVALEHIEPIISKTRECVLKMNPPKEVSEDFRRRFPLDASSRWSASFQMLHMAQKANESMQIIARDQKELGKRVLLSSEDKKVAKRMHDFLKPFDDIIKEMSESKYLTVGLTLLYLSDISEKLMGACEGSQSSTNPSPNWLKSVAERMITKVDIYNDKVFSTFTFMASVLDPRMKLYHIHERLNSKGFEQAAKSHFIKSYSFSHFTSIISDAQELEDEDNVLYAEKIARGKRRRFSAPEEFEKYLSSPFCQMKEDPLEWWKENSMLYPRLSVMARDYLAISTTSLAPKNLFFSRGDDIDMQRHSTPYENTRTLHCVMSWLQEGFKLKHKSGEIDYEGLMKLASGEQAPTRMRHTGL